MSEGCRGAVRVGTRVGYGTRWVPGRGIPVPSQLLARRSQNQRSGPGSPCQGAGVVGSGAGCARVPRPTHSGPLDLRGPLRWSGPSPRAKAASWSIRARFHLISIKVSQNDGVSPKYVEKACHSPCFQNGSRKSPLDFLGFPYSSAFSHKELMVPFWPKVGLLCQNDEVSPVGTPMSSRERVVRYPHCRREQARHCRQLLI